MIDLAEWNLTLPVPLPAAIVHTAELNARTFHSPFLQRGEGGSLIFWTPVQGTPLAPARYAATELRETRPDGSAYAWKYRDADALLQGEAMMQQVPTQGEVVISQIADQGSASGEPRPLLQLIYRVNAVSATTMQSSQGSLVARLRETPTDEGRDVALLERLPLKTRFSYDIKLARSGLLSLKAYNRDAHTGDIGLQLDPAWSSHHLYFKAGLQVLDDDGPADEGGRATFYRLISMHQPNNR